MIIAGCILVVMFAAKPANGDVVLSEKIMKLALTSAELSSLAYEEDPPGEGFEHFGFYDDEPDQAIVAERNGYCFGAFRGTTMTWVDWQQNFELGKKDVCITEGLKRHCCSTRSGFYKAYHTPYHKQLEEAIRKCAKTCKNPDECVVLTGHSQGGAIAAVAGLALADLNPYVITFGQPATIEAPCPMVSSERWYRFVNTKADGGIAYDPVPFVPGLGADFFGHMIMLGEDPTGVAYIGLDANQGFSPLNIAGFEAHSMVAPHEVPFPGYMDRLKTLMNTTTSFPIRANGFADHTLCSQSSECMSGRCGKETMWSENHCIGIECIQDDDCPSDRCEHGTCLVKLGSCMSCDEDSDCTGGKCLLFKCSGANSLMDDECICKWDSDCASGRCELLEAGVCEAQLAVGAKCNENSDCKSNLCGWSFRCNELSAQGAFCWKNSECLSGKCNWHFQCEGRGESATSTATVAESMAISEQTAASSVHTLFGGRLVLVVACIGVAMKYVVPAYHRQKNGYAEIVATEMSV